MELNSRLDQSLDEIIKENRKQKSQAKGKKRVAAKKATAVAAKASPSGAAKTTRRKKNASNGAAAGNVNAGIAARLGTASSPAKAIGKSASGRVGKAKKATKAESGGRLAGIAERKKVLELKKRAGALKAARPNLNISIKGEAGPATIFITNLDTEASAEDVKTCFKQFGTVKSCTLLYDRNGKASGHAEVVYASKVSALDAVAKLNNALADGRRLSVQMKPSSKPIAPAPPIPASSAAAHGSSLGRKSGRRSRKSGAGNRMDID
ncbi:RNA-binding domain-containing protein [Martensiomyces pterosporus]|nr:RNA-binding domain-containing protein [Martensiomyces pterosporus]